MSTTCEQQARRRWRRPVAIAAGVALAGVLIGASWPNPRTGAEATGARLERMQRSPQWDAAEARFTNRLPEYHDDLLTMAVEFFAGGQEGRVPEAPLTVVRRRGAEFHAAPTSGLRLTWLGHSTTLVEIDGQRLLLDPVWGERASPFSFAGPRRFHEPPLPLTELPGVDAVLISHDHYDHLDYGTVVELLPRDLLWVVPLGVGAHLQHWGVRPERIVELDWWQATTVGNLRLTATPARHFSGRSAVMADRDATLWSGWAIRGPAHNVYYSGDTALFPEIGDIGDRLGPFDASLIEVGAYGAAWPDVHLGPEQAVRAHRLVRGGVMLPVHWGTFDLALHSWTEPMERVLVAAEAEGVRVLTPRPGQSIEPAQPPPPQRWWPAAPWRRVSEAPQASTGVESIFTPATPIPERSM